MIHHSRSFGGTCHIHLQVRSISRERNQHEASSKLDVDPDDGDDTLLRNVGFLSADYKALYLSITLHNHRCGSAAYIMIHHNFLI
jgi:hypothetical protein